MADDYVKQCEEKMKKSIAALDHEFSGLRTGRASANLLDPVQVEVYGARMPLNQVATVNVPESRTIMVQVWDKSNVKAVEKAIVDANLGLNPAAEGQTVRINIPPLTEERRKELTKVAGKYSESTRVSIRNIRRDALDHFKKIEKNGDISEDEMHKYNDKIQKITDDFIKLVDEKLSKKEKEIMQV